MDGEDEPGHKLGVDVVIEFGLQIDFGRDAADLCGEGVGDVIERALDHGKDLLLYEPGLFTDAHDEVAFRHKPVGGLRLRLPFQRES